jgi:hypothetical protein
MAFCNNSYISHQGPQIPITHKINIVEDILEKLKMYTLEDYTRKMWAAKRYTFFLNVFQESNPFSLQP